MARDYPSLGFLSFLVSCALSGLATLGNADSAIVDFMKSTVGDPFLEVFRNFDANASLLLDRIRRVVTATSRDLRSPFAAFVERAKTHDRFDGNRLALDAYGSPA